MPRILKQIQIMKILLVEDNVRLRQLITDVLIHHGFAVDVASSLAEAKNMVAHFSCDLILLDLNLPDGDGLDLLKFPDHKKNKTPILVITARAGLDDRVQGLNCGADDYLIKPFATEELLARCRALLRRPGRVLGNVLRLGNIELHALRRTVIVSGRIVSIRPRELALLEQLMRHNEQVVTREHLLSGLYSSDQEISLNALEANISRLRKWLRVHVTDVMIHTAHGTGYVLAAKDHANQVVSSNV